MARRHDQHGDEGFTLVEVVVALGVFAVLATAFASTLSASLRSLTVSRQRTTAEQLVSSQMEEMRRVAYSDLGTVGGNPPGIVNPTKTVTNGNTRLTVETDINYVDDKVPTAKRTAADYKSVTVTVTSETSTELAVQRSFIAPPTQPSQTDALVDAKVTDYANQAPLAGVTVTLGTGPDAPISDTTDANGKVIFAALTPNPATGTQSTYTLTAALTGYRTYPEDVPPSPNASMALAAGATVTPHLRMYKPVTVNVRLVNAAGAPFTAATTLTATSTTLGTGSTAVTGGSTAITSVGSLALVPSNAYTFGASSPGYAASSVQVTLGAGYPNVLTTDVTLVMQQTYGQLQVTVKRINKTGVPNMNVLVTGGPSSVSLAGVTDAAGVAVFSVPSGTTPTYTVNVPAQSGFQATSTTLTGPSSTETVSVGLTAK
jgi:prepilin-type N-terminal cleavage/methylation domain-containing protein